MGDTADEDPDKLIIRSNSKEIIKTRADNRGSVDSQVFGYSGSNRRESDPLGLDEGARRLRKGSVGDDLEEVTPANAVLSWDKHFVPIDGRRVSVLTNASYALGNTSPHIGLGGCIMVVVGCVLGAGIFAAPDTILSQLTSASLALVIWVAFGVIAVLAALCYVELGLTFPVSGGDYAYLNECFGPVAGFLFQWADNLVSIPCIMAIMSQIAAKNILHPFFCDDVATAPPADWISRFMAIEIIMLLCYVNCKSPKLTERVGSVLMLINLTAICLVIICGMVFIGFNGVYENDNFTIGLPDPGPEKTKEWSKAALIKYQILQIVRALFTASFAYLGYTRLGYISEEVKNPTRNLPLGILISMTIVISLNVFVNFCYFETLERDVIKGTRTVASDMFSAVLPEEHRDKIVWIASTLVAIGIIGGLSGHILTSSRIAFAGARNGHFPRIFSLVHHKNGTPNVSLIWIGISSCFYILVGNIRPLISIAVYLETIFNCSCIYGLIFARFRQKTLPRPFKLPLVIPIVYVTLATLLFVIPIVTLDEDTYLETIPSVGGAFAVLITGIPIYFICVRPEACTCQCLHTLQVNLIIFLQKLLSLAPEEDEGALENLDVLVDQNRSNEKVNETTNNQEDSEATGDQKENETVNQKQNETVSNKKGNRTSTGTTLRRSQSTKW